jgi:hypothetical protein
MGTLRVPLRCDLKENGCEEGDGEGGDRSKLGGKRETEKGVIDRNWVGRGKRKREDRNWVGRGRREREQ